MKNSFLKGKESEKKNQGFDNLQILLIHVYALAKICRVN